MTCSKSVLAFGFVAAVGLAMSSPAYAQRGGGHAGGGHAVAAGHGAAVARGGAVYGGGAVVRGGAVYGGRAVVYGHPGYYGGYHYGVVGYAPYRPYYYYRPGVTIGFYAGWGYPYYGYGYPYYYPYAYSYPYPYYYNPYPYYSYPSSAYPAYPQQQSPYPDAQQYPQQQQYQQPDQQQYPPQPQGSVSAQPGGPAYGGVRISNAPHDGQVYVDGKYAGIVDDFDGDNKHLNLTAGMHQIEIRINGQQPMGFDVNVPANQTITVRVQ